jgi:transcriptional regulator with XRE-family HTH domain
MNPSYEYSIQAVGLAVKPPDSLSFYRGRLVGTEEFGVRVFQARKALEQRLGRAVPQTEVGKRMGVHGVTVGSWESGAKEPSLETIARLAVILEVSPAWLAFGIEPMVLPEANHRGRLKAAPGGG